MGGRVKHENLVLSNEFIKVELPSSNTWKAGVSSVSPSLERVEELWMLLAFMRMSRSFAFDGNMMT